MIERDDRERCDGVAEAYPVASEKVGRDEGREQAAESEEEVDEVERGGTVRFAHVADEGVGSGDDDSAADSKHKKKHDDGAIAGERGRA